MVRNSATTRLIDFDDCGHGWFLYDFAASISFIEDDPRIPAFKDAWVRGYRSIRDLNAEDEAEIETFIMLRRMALLAWIGSHIEAPEAQKLAPEFASVTAKIGKLYLEQCKMLTGNYWIDSNVWTPRFLAAMILCGSAVHLNGLAWLSLYSVMKRLIAA